MERVAAEREARRGGGLYGYPRAIQVSCENATRRLVKRAAVVIGKAVKRDRHVLAFLETHVARGNSTSARILLAAYRDSMPQLSAPRERVQVVTEDDLVRVAADARLGMYGYPVKTAKLGLTSCTFVREAAGILAADLHRRRSDYYVKVTGFLGEHGKTGGCNASNLILRSYPEPGFKFRRRRAAVEGTPTTVDEWLRWDLVTG
jgi:hypothetical protein